MFRTVHIVVSLMALFIARDVVRAQPPTAPREPTAEVEQDRIERLKFHDQEALITRELRDLDRTRLEDSNWAKEWAGEYHSSLQRTIRLAPTNGMSYSAYACTGVYDFDHGSVVEATSDSIRIKLAKGRRNTWQGISDRLYFVRWDTERYIVPENEMLNVINEFNAGGYHRETLPHAYRLDPKGFRYGANPRSGFPTLPAAYAALYEEVRLTLRITKIEEISSPNANNDGGPRGLRQWRLEFDKGLRDGIADGMAIPTNIYDEQPNHAAINIVGVSPSDSKGFLCCVDNPVENPRWPKLGDTFEVLLFRRRATPAPDQPAKLQSKPAQSAAPAPSLR